MQEISRKDGTVTWLAAPQLCKFIGGSTPTGFLSDIDTNMTAVTLRNSNSNMAIVTSFENTVFYIYLSGPFKVSSGRSFDPFASLVNRFFLF